MTLISFLRPRCFAGFCMGPRHSLAGIVAVLLAASVAQAAKPQSWTFVTQRDYAQGKFENTVVSSYGELMLGRKLTPIETAPAAEIVSAFAQTPDGSVYVAVGPEGKVYKLGSNGEKSTVVYTVPKGFTDITALAADREGNLLIALSGEKARLVSLKPGAEGHAAATTRFENKDVDYIWAIRQGADGTLYLGTGPHGKVYALGANGGAGEGAGATDVVLETSQKNIIALAFDKEQNLVAGTDGHGLVIRIDHKTKKPFVLLDAGKVDVNAIVADPQGNLYVATAKPQLPGEGDGAGMGQDDATTKSKPDVPETEPVDPSDDDDAPMKGAPAPDATQQGAATWGHRNLCAAADTALSNDLKALLKRAAQARIEANDAARRGSPGTKKSAGQMARKRRKLPHNLAGLGQEDEEAESSSTVYRIAPDGAVTTLVQDGGMNYAMLLNGDQLLIGTGDEGKLFSYGLTDHALTLIARVKQQEISALFAAADGNILLGTGNMGQVYSLGRGIAAKGTFTSQVMDASHSAYWGHIAINQSVPAGMKVTVETRSGNTQDVEANSKFWSDWAPATADEDPESLKVHSPTARFLQVRLALDASGKSEGDSGKSETPVVSGWKVGYQTQNLPPRVKNLSVDLPGASPADDSAATDPDVASPSDDATPPSQVAHLNWDASDPNDDTLVYRLYYRVAKENHAPTAEDAAADGDPWTLLAKDVKDTTFDWDTHSVPDGIYQVKVVASDSPDNPAKDALETARTSAPVTINHTPPAIEKLTGSSDGPRVKVSGEAKTTSALSAVTDVRYQVDGGGDWQPAAASDKIFDSPQEAFTIVTRPLSAGPHRITVRATDAAGNNSYKVVTVRVKP